MCLGGIVRLSAFGFRHLMDSSKTVEFGFDRKIYSIDASAISPRSSSDNSSRRPQSSG
jgi:hypothetical protein